MPFFLLFGEAVQSRIPNADLDHRDPDYIREMLPGAWLLGTLWHRADVRGLANIPDDELVLTALTPSGVVEATLSFPTDGFVMSPMYAAAVAAVVEAWIEVRS